MECNINRLSNMKTNFSYIKAICCVLLVLVISLSVNANTTNNETIDIGLGSVSISMNDENSLKVTYVGFDGGSRIFNTEEAIVVTGTTGDNFIELSKCKAKVTIENISITTANGIRIIDGSTCNLTLCGDNNITASDDAAINCTPGSTLIIDGEGSLIARAGNNYASAIGGVSSECAGTIIINGGRIVANGLSYGAGIGGGDYCWADKIEINGGEIKAESYFGAAIGGGLESKSSGKIIINGGTIRASSYWGAGIGAGGESDQWNVTINGGNINASTGAGEAVGSGSDVYHGKKFPKDSLGNDVFLTTITLPVEKENELNIASIDVIDYGLNDFTTVDHKLYVYLPTTKSISTITTDNNAIFVGSISGGESTTFKCTHNHFENNICSGCGMYKYPTPTECEKDENDRYIISTLDELGWFANLVNSGTNTMADAVITEDIDAREEPMLMIGSSNNPYKGTLNGNGNTITIALERNFDYTGLIQYAKDVHISNLIVDGLIITSGKFAAGIISHLSGSSSEITNCISNVKIISSVEGDGTHGGIIANSDCSDLLIDNCGFTGSIIGEKTDSNGGIIGWVNKKATIKNSYVAATFAINTTNSNTFARNILANSIENCYYLNSLGEIPQEVLYKSESQFKSGEVTYLLNNGVTDGSQSWYQTCGEELPSIKGLTVYQNNCSYCGNPIYDNELVEDSLCGICPTYEEPKLVDGVYEIDSASKLMWFATMINNPKNTIVNNDACVRLTADIDLDGYEWKTICPTDLYYSGYGEDFGYSGIFDGNGYIIKNITVKSSVEKDASCGLFGTVSGTIKNLGIEGFTFVDGGKDIRAGAIAGQLITANGKVSNCYVVDATINPYDHVIGGIAGCAYEATIENCYVISSTIAGNRYGYIVGDSRGDKNNEDRKATINNCYTDIDIIYGSQTGNISNCGFYGPRAFNSGQVTYLLQGSQQDQIWGQNIDNNAEIQLLPTFNGAKVYYGYVCDEGVDEKIYTNRASANPEEKPAHNYENGICTECGHEDTIGIENVSINDECLNEDVLYDLQGRTIKSPTKGIYIRNGKKVIVK